LATNDKRARLYNRKFTSVSFLDTYLYGTLHNNITDVLARTYTSGVISGGVLSSSQANTVTVSAIQAITGTGNILDVVTASLLDNIPFENTNLTTYYVGLKYVEVEASDPVASAVETNAQTGVPEYAYWQEQLGELGNPDSITDNGDNTITLVVDGLTESGHSWAGRTVRVWLATLLSTSSGWYEDLTIQWDGSHNYVTTTGNFHQLSVRGVISTTVTAYRVWVKGITITTTDISSNSDYVFLGTITGNGATPVAFNQTGMQSVATFGNFFNNLNQLAKDINGDNYSFFNTGTRSSRIVGAFTDGDTTPDISNYESFATANTFATTITSLDGGVIGDIRQIIAKDSNTTLQHSSVLALANGIDFAMALYDSITFECVATDTWHEIYRTEINYIGTTSSTTTSSSTSSTSSTTSTTSSTISTSSTTSSTQSTISTSSTTSSTISTSTLSTTSSTSSSTTSSSTSSSSTSSSSTTSSSTSSSSSSSSTSSTSWSTTSTSTSTSSSSSSSSTCSSTTTRPGFWTLGNDLNTARRLGAGAGIQSAALSCGGATLSGISDITEEYNGTCWAASNAILTPRYQLGAFGTQTAVVSVAGLAAGSTVSNTTEEYDGTSWVASNNCTARYGIAACGTQLAGLKCGGLDAAVTPTTTTEEYNGTNWSNGGSLNAARYALTAAGVQTAALGIAGYALAVLGTVEEYDGTCWAMGGSISVARYSAAACGLQNAGLCFGGNEDPDLSADTEEYNGTSWFAGGDLNVARYALEGCGTQSDGLSMTGRTTVNVATTEEYMK